MEDSFIANILSQIGINIGVISYINSKPPSVYHVKYGSTEGPLIIMNVEANHYQAVYTPSNYQPPSYEEYISNTPNKALEYALYILFAWSHISPRLEEHLRTFMFADDLPAIEPNLEATKYYYDYESKRFEIEDDFDDEYDPEAINNKLPSDLPKFIIKP